MIMALASPPRAFGDPAQAAEGKVGGPEWSTGPASHHPRSLRWSRFRFARAAMGTRPAFCHLGGNEDEVARVIEPPWRKAA